MTSNNTATAIVPRPAAALATPARVAILGGPGCGKTYGALALARGLAGDGGRVCVIDTERLRSCHYARIPAFGAFDVIDLAPPFSPSRFEAALAAAWDGAYDVVVLDSLSHEWAGVGGVLEMVDDAKGRNANAFTAWSGPSAEHKRLIDRIVRSPSHVIVTMRQREGYEIGEDPSTGKRTVRRLGLQAIQRDEVEYDFDAILQTERPDGDASVIKCNAAWNSALRAAIATDRRITPTLGVQLRAWLAEGAPVGTVAVPAPAARGAEVLRPPLADPGRVTGAGEGRFADVLPGERAVARVLANDPAAIAIRVATTTVPAAYSPAKAEGANETGEAAAPWRQASTFLGLPPAVVRALEATDAALLPKAAANAFAAALRAGAAAVNAPDRDARAIILEALTVAGVRPPAAPTPEQARLAVVHVADNATPF